MPEFYIPRTLRTQDEVISQEALLTLNASFIIILAEPGAGKTDLLSDLAHQLNTKRYRANIFKNRVVQSTKDVLIIDGFDEVSKLEGENAIDAVLTKISVATPKLVVLSSRASEWNDSRNRGLISEYLDIPENQIVTLYLQPLTYQDQHVFFDHHKKIESDFATFYNQCTKFRLQALLENPLFLKLFLMAYDNNAQVFDSKSAIFQLAINNLAKEHNTDLPAEQRSTTEQLITLAEGIFTKLLLAGLSGICLSEQDQTTDFPYLFELDNLTPKEQLRQIIDTGLFKPSDTSCYEPVHRIIAEYCAANYLVKKIQSPSDLLSINRCLSVIAPNRVVRTELRGLLGWMAALGNEKTQQAIITLDVYSVLANGDASQLTTKSKYYILIALEKLQEENPYFRASDGYRSVNIKNLITPDMVPKIQELLLANNSGFHLRSLLLEIMDSPEIASLFTEQLITLLMDVSQYKGIRDRIIINLFLLKESWNYQEVFNQLVQRKQEDDLEYAADIVKQLGVSVVGKEVTLSLLIELANLFPAKYRHERVIGKRLFIKLLIQSFSLEDTEYFLDSLTPMLRCSCDKDTYDCTCKNGISKVMGHLLDRYFELAVENNYNIKKLANWLKDLRYSRGYKPIDKNLSTEILQNDGDLRYHVYVQLIQTGHFSTIYEHLHTEQLHAGFVFYIDDWQRLIIYAFDTENITLWELLYVPHSSYWNDENRDYWITLRRLLRFQAKKKSEFMRVWAKPIAQQKKIPKHKKNYGAKYIRRNRKYTSEAQERFNKNNNYLIANEDAIKQGKDWKGLDFFSINYLVNIKEILQYKDRDFIEEALINGLSLLMPELPSIEELVQDRVKGQTPHIIYMLYAICLATFRKLGTLTSIPKEYLKLVRYLVDVHIENIKLDDQKAIANEIDSLIFQSKTDIKDYFEQVITPLLSANKHVSLYWILEKESWKEINLTFCIGWLEKNPCMDMSNLIELFNYCIKHQQTKLLKPIIIKNTDYTINHLYGPFSENEKLTPQFWLEAAFFLTEDSNDKTWDILKQAPDAWRIFYDIVSPFSSTKDSWPNLSADKIYKVLDYFIERFIPTNEHYAWSSSNSEEEKKYSTLVGLIKLIEKDEVNGLVIFDKMLLDTRFCNLYEPIRHHRYELNKRITLQTFQPPTYQEIVNLLDNNKIGSLEDLRAFILEQLTLYQQELKGLETNPINVFYQGEKHVDENTARDRVVDWLRPRLSPLDITLNIESAMVQTNRCDITASISLNGQHHLLVIEAKGQWHSELYSAAEKQLYERYSIHPNAADQGIYLVFWFGKNVKVANKKHTIETAQSLKESIEAKIPASLKHKVDVFVLDVSR